MLRRGRRNVALEDQPGLVDFRAPIFLSEQRDALNVWPKRLWSIAPVVARRAALHAPGDGIDVAQKEERAWPQLPESGSDFVPDCRVVLLQRQDNQGLVCSAGRALDCPRKDIVFDGKGFVA